MDSINMSQNRPRIMGILNASPDSVAGGIVNPDNVLSLAAQLLDDGASLLDIGGQSLRTDVDEIPMDLELDRVLSVLDPIASTFPNATLSIDTYRSGVALAAIERGASIVNDVSGNPQRDLVEAVAASVRPIDLVLTYNHAVPKVRLTSDALVSDVVSACIEDLGTKLHQLETWGLGRERVILDLGIDLGKSPQQSVEVLRATTFIRRRLGDHRILWALSHKDFIGAILQAPPSGRRAGTLAAIGSVEFEEGDILRVHDVASTRDYLLVQEVLASAESTVEELHPDLRHD